MFPSSIQSSARLKNKSSQSHVLSGILRLISASSIQVLNILCNRYWQNNASKIEIMTLNNYKWLKQRHVANNILAGIHWTCWSVLDNWQILQIQWRWCLVELVHSELFATLILLSVKTQVRETRGSCSTLTSLFLFNNSLSLYQRRKKWALWVSFASMSCRTDLRDIKMTLSNTGG